MRFPLLRMVSWRGCAAGGTGTCAPMRTAPSSQSFFMRQDRWDHTPQHNANRVSEYRVMEFLSVKIHKYNFALKLTFNRGAFQSTLKVLCGIWGNALFHLRLHRLYNPFSTVHFLQKLEINKMASWSYCPIFPFLLYLAKSDILQWL